MGVYTRFKRDASGFRSLVELLESTPHSLRKKMIDAGMAEDPNFTEAALKYVLSFEDVLKLSDPELAELMAVTPPRMIAMAIQPFSQEIQDRFLRNARPPTVNQVKDFIDVKSSLKDIGTAQLKVVGFTRGLERKGFVKAKKIPMGLFKE